MNGHYRIFFSALFVTFSLGAHIIRDRDEAHHVTQQMLKREGVRHRHEDIQKLRDEFAELKDAALSGEDPVLKEKLEHPGRKRSLPDEVRMHNIERSVHGDPSVPKSKARIPRFFFVTFLSCAPQGQSETSRGSVSLESTPSSRHSARKTVNCVVRRLLIREPPISTSCKLDVGRQCNVMKSANEKREAIIRPTDKIITDSYFLSIKRGRRRSKKKTPTMISIVSPRKIR